MKPPFCPYVHVSISRLYHLLNALTNLYETWYVYHGTWAHLNGILHKSLPLVCVSLCVSPIVARQRLGKSVSGNEYARNNRRIVGRVVFCAVRVVWNESRWLFFPRTSCLCCKSVRITEVALHFSFYCVYCFLSYSLCFLLCYISFWSATLPTQNSPF
jgi:hypothetical protein